MPAGALVDRADVEAGRAADAVQRLAAHLVGEHRRPPVVEQHEVELLRAVAGGDPGPERGVGVHPLAGGAAGEQLQEHLEVAPGGHHLLDAHDRDQRLRQGQAHPAVALALDDGERAGLGDGEVGAADRDPGAEEPLAQVRPGGHGQLPRVVGQAAGRRPGMVRRKISRISARFLWMAGTRMWLRLVLAELHDQLGQVGLVRGDAGGLERLVERRSPGWPST